MGKLVEMLWDCPYCKTKGILGRHRECPNCGNPRGDGVKFYMPGEIKYVEKEKAKKINRNPDWQCSFCGSLNNDSDKICKSCAAPRAESDKNYFDLHRKDDEIEILETESVQRNHFTQEPSQKKRRKRKKINKVFIILSLLLFCISFIPHKETLKVTGISWNREIKVEQSETIRKSDWKLPPDAQLVEKNEEIHHYDKIIDHYETKTRTKSREVIDGYETVVTGYKDLGNGYSEEITEERPVYRTEYYEEEYQDPVYVKVPIYKTKYYYDIEEWNEGRSITTKGNDKSPYWGEVSLEDKEREGKRSEEYKITVIDEDKKSQSHILDYSTWKQIEKKDIITIRVNFWGTILEMKDHNGKSIELK